MADKTSRKSSQRTRLNPLNSTKDTDTPSTSTASIFDSASNTSTSQDRNLKKRKSFNSSFTEQQQQPVATSSFASTQSHNTHSKSLSSLVNSNSRSDQEENEEDELTEEKEEESVTKPKSKDKKRKRNLSKSNSATSTEFRLAKKENKVSRSNLANNSLELGSDRATGKHNQAQDEQTNTEEDQQDEDLTYDHGEQETEEDEESNQITASKQRHKNLKRRRLSSNESKATSRPSTSIKVTRSSRRSTKKEEESEPEPIVIDQDENIDEEEEDNNITEIEKIPKEATQHQNESSQSSRLRRSSSSKSTSQSIVEQSITNKKLKISPSSSQNSTSSLVKATTSLSSKKSNSKLETEAINLKYQQSKKETGACTSKPSTSTTTTHLVSSRRGLTSTAAANADNLFDQTVAVATSSNTDVHTAETATNSKHSNTQLAASAILDLTSTNNSSLLSKLKSHSAKNSSTTMNQDNTNQSSKNASKQTSKQSSTSATATTAAAAVAAGTTAPTSGTVSSAASSVGPLSGFASASFAGADRGMVGLIESADSSDNDTTTAEFSRLTDLLQARGLPTHIVNAFGSKVQQFLHRTMSSGITSRSSQLVNSLQQNDESLKLTALSELCQLLVMGNEDTLVGFPIKQAVPLLLQCMRSDSENYVLMNHACRALTYMMESLPRSSSIIAEGIGVFLEKLQVIQCMDVAEQSLTALEILSRRHSKQILNATQSGSISACLTYIDFFSITAQRNALQITANCCQNVIKDEFVHIQSSLPILSQRLSHSDKKSVESVCTVFARLVENFQRDRLILKEIASHQVLTNMQQLLVTQPAVVSPSIFVTVLHTIYLMCANCNELAIELLENNIAGTFRQLLVGAKSTSEQDQTLLKQHETIEILSSRSPQELYEIVSIIGEIMPRLPQTGLFAIDEILRKTYLANQNEHVLWQWKDERDVWRPYTPVDSRIIESAFSQEEDECILNTMGRTYVLDFNSMLQINEDTGTTRPIARKVLSSTSQQQQQSSSISSSNNNVNTISSNNETISASGTNNSKQNDFTTIQVKEEDNRLSYLEKNPKLYAQFVSTLFSILYEVYNSSAGPALKHKSLRAILRMIFYSSKNVINQDDNNNNKGTSPSKLNEDSKTTATVQQEALAKSTNNSENNILYNLLKTLPISSHIASMLASTDPKIIVSALQICEILMQKMPDVFSVYFHREGVIHQIDRLIETGSISSSAQKAAIALSNQINSVKVEQKNSDNITVTASMPSSSSSVAPAKPSEQTQRKTRSATAASAATAAAAAAAAITASNTGVTNQLNKNSEASNSNSSSGKRKVRTMQVSKQSTSLSSGGLFSSSSTSSNSNTAAANTSSTPAAATTIDAPNTSQPSLTSSTSKYFRNIITKMHGGGSSSSTSNHNNLAASAQLSSNSATSNATSTNKSNSSFQAFSLIAPQPSSASSSASLRTPANYYTNNNNHNYLSQTTSSLQRNAATAASSDISHAYSRNEPPPPPPTSTSGSIWSQLKSSTSSSHPAYSSLMPFSATSRRKTSGPTSTSSNPLQSHNLMSLNPLVNLQKQQQQQLSSIDYNLINQNKERVRQWIYEQAKKFKETYFSSLSQPAGIEMIEIDSKSSLTAVGNQFNSGLTVLKRLKEVVDQLDLKLFLDLFSSVNQISLDQLDSVNNSYMTSLKEISNILNSTDISSFEMIHSGLIEKLGLFLGISSDETSFRSLENKYMQIVKSVKQHQELRISMPVCYVNDLDQIIKNEFNILRCKQFLHVFSQLPISFFHSLSNSSASVVDDNNNTNRNRSTAVSLFSILLLKLHNCVNQLEQFAVRVHDVPTSVGYGKTAAIKFFNTHQFKCLLRRHPSCSNTTSPTKLGSKSAKPASTHHVSQWKGGPVKVDPLAAVSTIEKYLICRGLHRPSVAPSSSTGGSSTSGFLSSSLPSSSLATAATKSSKTKSKSPSSRLFMFKAAAEMATDRFKSKKSKSKPAATVATATSSKSATIAINKKSTSSKSSKAEESLPMKVTDTKSKITKTTIKKNKKSKSMNSSASSSIASSSTTAAASTSTSSKSARLFKSSEKSKSSKAKTKKSSAMDTSSKSFSGQDYIEEEDEEDDEVIGADHDDDEDDDDEDIDDFGEIIGESIENDEYDFNEDVEISNDNEQVIDLEEDDDDEDDEGDDDEDDDDDEELDEDDDETYENQIAEEEIEESGEENELDDEDDEDDEDDDDGDIESAMNAILGANSARSGAGSSSFKNFYLSSFTSGSGTPLPKFELLINENVLPSNMSIYQAIKLYSSSNSTANQASVTTSATAASANRNDDIENDAESSLLNNAIWSKVHTIHYRLAQPNTIPVTATSSSSSSKPVNFDISSSSTSKRNTRTSSSTSKQSKTASKSNEMAGDESAGENNSFQQKNDSGLSVRSNINSNLSSTVFFSYLSCKWPVKNGLTLHDQSMEAISFLRLLNALNRDWFLMYQDLFGQNELRPTNLEQQQPTFLISSEQFVNTKLTAKANRQLQDPLVIMTGHLPKWLPELMRTCAFLFPFRTRLMYFYVSSLDRDRAMQKLIDMNADLFQAEPSSTSTNSRTDRFVPRLEKKKRTIIRSNDLIKQADTILNEFAVNTTATSSTGSGMSSYSHSKPALLEIQYENEVGTGLGPTLEFYALLSLEVQKCDYEMWRGEKTNLSSAGGQNQNQLFYFAPNGLFPSPINTFCKQSSKQQTHLTKLKTRFKFLGKFFAKAIMDFRVVDIQLSYVFYKWLIDPNSLCAEDIKYIDSQLFKSIESLKDYLRKQRNLIAKAYMTKENMDSNLKQIKVEIAELEKSVLDLDLDFTLPGYSSIELKKGGKDIIVNLENLDEYLNLIVEWTLIKGVEKQLEAFKEGFESILSISCLQQFYPEELEKLFCGSSYHEWDIKLLSECTRCDHGYTHESTAVKNLFEIMCSFNSDEQRQFLQFITGSPRLPVGGLRSLVPPLTIVRKSVEVVSSSTNTNADSYLPSVMTCVNYLKLPDYSSLNIMKEKLCKAMKDGQLSFHLS